MDERLMPLARPDDASKQAQLDHMKRRATALLVGATVLFAITRWLEARHPWLGYVRATAEAAMVGGLADWFAVTALFRHPLGLPIPHTSIVASRKDRIGRSLGNFVQNNFLSREVISRKLAQMHIADRAVRWLAAPEHARLIARQVATGLARTVEAVPDEAATQLIGDSLAARLRATRVAPLLGNVLSFITADSRHQDLLDDALRLVEQAVDDNRELIRLKVAEESPWWVPGVVDDQIYYKIVSAIENLLHDVHDDPNHPLRAKFDVALVRFIDNLKHSPAMIARTEALKEELLDRPLLDELSTTIWRGARNGIVRYAAHDGSASDAAIGSGEAAVGRTGATASGAIADEGRAGAAANPDATAGGAATNGAATAGERSVREPGALERGIASFADAVLRNEAVLTEIDDFLTTAALTVIEQHRHEVGELIANTVSAWDAEATSRRIELAIGRDLQFIRINGTLVGGLAGLAIYVISTLF